LRSRRFGNFKLAGIARGKESSLMCRTCRERILGNGALKRGRAERTFLELRGVSKGAGRSRKARQGKKVARAAL